MKRFRREFNKLKFLIDVNIYVNLGFTINSWRLIIYYKSRFKLRGMDSVLRLVQLVK